MKLRLTKNGNKKFEELEVPLDLKRRMRFNNNNNYYYYIRS